MKLYSFIITTFFASMMLSACSNNQPTPPKAEPIPEAKPARHIPYPQGVKRPKLSEHELHLISNRIYFNEASSKPENLLIWNDNEQFVSLGIGHFIWYPQGARKRFDETFPSLIDYLQQHGVPIPFWLLSARQTGAPWPDKASFLQSSNDPEVRELKRILVSTKELQTLFFFDRIHESIPRIVNQAPANKRHVIIQNYNAVANTSNGWYPLIDYINFKGTGLKVSERYNGYGWGLSHVLQEMRLSTAGPQALTEFSQAASYVLERRIDNSPEENDEARWFAGWKKRLGSYTHTLQ